MFTTSALDCSDIELPRPAVSDDDPQPRETVPWAQHDQAWCQRALAEFCSVDTTSGSEFSLSSRLLHELAALEPDSLSELPVVGERCNLLATWGRPRLLLTTHVDVVPAGGWAGAFNPVTDAHGLVARGACDAKGQIVAQFAAIRRLVRLGLTDFAWLGVVDEERDSLGARAVCANPPAVLDGVEVVLNGEPTRNVVASSQQGFERWSLECRSEARHSASAGDSSSGAVSQLIQWLGEFETVARQQAAHHSFFGTESYNISSIDAGVAPNIVAPVARSQVTLRTVGALDLAPDEVQETAGSWQGARTRPIGLAAALERARPKGASLKLRHRSAPLVFSRWADEPAAPVAFGSDAVHLVRLSRQGLVVLVGPGSIENAHTDRETIEWEELAVGVDRIEALARRVLSGDLPNRLPECQRRGPVTSGERLAGGRS